jgi:hypothetical protein
MTVHQHVQFVTAMASLLALGALLMALSWFAPGVTTTPHEGLMLAGTAALGMFAIGLFASVAEWMARQPNQEACRWCSRMRDVVDLKPLATGGRVCTTCLTPTPASKGA